MRWYKLTSESRATRGEGMKHLGFVLLSFPGVKVTGGGVMMHSHGGNNS